MVQGPKSDFRACFGAILGPKRHFRDPNRLKLANFGIPSLQAQNPRLGLLRNPKRDRIALIGFQCGFGVIPVPKRDGIPLLEPFEGISVPIWDWNLLDLTLSVALGPKAHFRGPIGRFQCFGAILGPKSPKLVEFWDSEPALNPESGFCAASDPETGPEMGQSGES